ncbi:uncharacterized protein A1O9_11536 [Exophiala aquamarina CBS 119918]|uniref:BZIP domain-containing protein n=1 Tax=Exophiala aquamarina CBS 119918 TaxID=1182545 RepID=A0A072NXK4_9EURO|nr:uncharacterized protein A1O9_11536 [Exophiala aquamarina CBS 119918]KEF52296.1 hypothetical protein A1O9_11536 [Exophiala aquamarina CBS 119918]
MDSLGEGSAMLNIEMLGHDQARSVDELWAGKSDIKERRKLQNRLNRRAYRKRQSDLRVQQIQEQPFDATQNVSGQRSKRRKIPGSRVFSINREDPTQKRGQIFLKDLVQSSKLSPVLAFSISEGVATPSSQESPDGRSSTEPWDEPFQHTTEQALTQPERFGDILDAASSTPGSHAALFEQNLNVFDDGLSLYSPSSDGLLTLIYYNVFRGLSKNIRALKLDLNLMRTLDYQSPFITGNIDLSTLPPDFQPTLLQQTIPHHPCFDIFPDPVLRDNAIRSWAADLPFGNLCINLAGRSHWQEIDFSQRHGCILWGAADSADSWEVTEAFASRWPYLVKGTYRLQAATNKWRSMRGEQPIYFA